MGCPAFCFTTSKAGFMPSSCFVCGKDVRSLIIPNRALEPKLILFIVEYIASFCTRRRSGLRQVAKTHKMATRKLKMLGNNTKTRILETLWSNDQFGIIFVFVS